jgi:protein SCO1/2
MSMDRAIEAPMTERKRKGPLRLFLPVALACSLASGGGAGQVSAAGTGPRDDQVKVELHDLELIDQDGRCVRFRSDVIGDRAAVVIPFYTTCTSSFPILIFILARLQDLLEDRLGREVVLVSVTVDPRTDIPARLKAYAKKQKARPGWVFLSGDRRSLGQVLCGMGILSSANVEDHNHIPVTMVGSTWGSWRRFHGFPTPEQILGQVEETLASKPAP